MTSISQKLLRFKRVLRATQNVYTTPNTLFGEKNTPSVPNYKTFQESWRVKAISSLTKIIEKNIKIYDIKLMYYENITNKESNGT